MIRVVVAGGSAEARQVGLALSARGHDVALIGDTPTRKSPAPAAVGCDLTDADAVARALDRCRAELGSVNAVVSVASSDWPTGPLADFETDAWLGALDRALWPTLALAGRAPAVIADTGTVVAISTLADLAGVAGRVLHASATEGLRALVKSCADQLSPTGVRVHAVLTDDPTGAPVIDVLELLASERAATLTGAVWSLDDRGRP